MRDMGLSTYRIFVGVVLILAASGQAIGQASESPYETIMRLRREAVAKETGRPPSSGMQAASAGPVTSQVEPEPAPQAGKSPEVRPDERILHFPSDRSLGKIMIRPASSGETADTFQWWIYGREWEFIGQAQGDVMVPAGHEVSLSVWHQEGWRDLAPLLKLGPDDLYQLGIHGSDTGGPRPGDSCMRYIAHLTGLRTLSLVHTNIGSVGMQHVAGLKELRHLVLPDRIDERGVAHVAGLTSLEGLSFGDNNVTDAVLEHLARLDSLTELELGGEKITGAGVAHLAGLPRLRHITFRGKSFSGSAFARLSDVKGLEVLCFRYLERITGTDLGHLSNISRLEDLNLYWCMNITDAGLVPLQRLPHLRRLNIDHARLTDEGLARLKEIKTLEALNLPLTGVTDRGLQCLSEMPRLRHLRMPRGHSAIPNVDKDGYTDEGLRALSKLTALESLCIGSAAITDRGIQHLATLTGLKRLGVFGCERLTDESLQTISRFHSLENLVLHFSPLTISGLKGLNSLTNLRNLNLNDITQDNSGLDWSGLTNLEDLIFNLKSKRVAGTIVAMPFQERDIAALGKLPCLRRLQTSHSGATDAALRHLTGLKRLENLSIGGDGLTDEGLACLAELPRLRDLNLSGRFTDRALEHLQKLPNLETLDFLSGANFSPAALSRFHRNMPRLAHYSNREQPMPQVRPGVQPRTRRR